MENDMMKCEKCGGAMKKMEDGTMVCEGCGAVVKMADTKKDESAGDDKMDAAA
jgi:transcription initiation factor TFIIIB Brf1 subunit/transcription initiation factor TFIIB